MKLTRLAAMAIAALVLGFPLAGGPGPALAQLQRAQPQTGRAPVAAPSAQAEAGAPLAAPSGNVDATLVGPQSENEQRMFTVLGLFERADIVVKCVLVFLLLASFWVWVRIFDKWLMFGSLRRKADKFEQQFWSGRSIDELYQYYSSRSDHPFTALFVAGLREWKRSFEHGSPRESAHAGMKERVEKAMNVAILRETEKIERGLGYLATVGSVAPFVGLFGTVWGIMNSFQSIALRQDTTLAVVAPGIAEALFATALGLVAAIPAVIAYNRFVSELGRYSIRLENFADEFSAYLSRQLEERAR